jgi:predicted O-linked N-acetylglucosamine transferase (SPINDLY family)
MTILESFLARKLPELKWDCLIKVLFFCCFNSNYKITPKEFDVWMRVLKKVDGSVLWLRNSNDLSEKNLRNEATRRGVDASRLVFAQKVPMDIHLARQKLADLFLDTFVYNAHSTATEALWLGLPVVSKIGKKFCFKSSCKSFDVS